MIEAFETFDVNGFSQSSTPRQWECGRLRRGHQIEAVEKIGNFTGLSRLGNEKREQLINL